MFSSLPRAGQLSAAVALPWQAGCAKDQLALAAGPNGTGYPEETVMVPLTAGIGAQYKYFREDQSGTVLREGAPNSSLTPGGSTQAVPGSWH